MTQNYQYTKKHISTIKHISTNGRAPSTKSVLCLSTRKIVFIPLLTNHVYSNEKVIDLTQRNFSIFPLINYLDIFIRHFKSPVTFFSVLILLPLRVIIAQNILIWDTISNISLLFCIQSPIPGPFWCFRRPMYNNRCYFSSKARVKEFEGKFLNAKIENLA